MTEYERQRQRNIQRNRELMMQLSLKKMADNIKPDEEENAAKKRGPKKGWKKNRGPVALLEDRAAFSASRRSASTPLGRIFAWTSPSRPTPTATLSSPRSALASPTTRGASTVPTEIMIPGGYFAEGEFMSETLYCWTDMLGKHFVAWGEAEGDRQRHVETEDGGSDTAGSRALYPARVAEAQARALWRHSRTWGLGAYEHSHENR